MEDIKYSYDVRKRNYLRWGRSTLGENFLRFGRNDLNYPNYGYRIGKRSDPDEDIFDDKGYLRFGRRSWPPVVRLHMRRKRAAETEDQSGRSKRSGDSMSQAKEKKSKVWFGEQDTGAMKRGDGQDDGYYYGVMKPNGIGADKRFMRFGRNHDEMGNGWLHFGKRSSNK
ncbi:FMRFamide-related neuropeptides-like [Gigantopelta aegis]|uniref:FMRFamide-related neuropeptides-like n=1 Tax=Gigantopelta aegis TaxID=1735272 RepID=UPI001B888E98|nr:FMRFamide-related neuropeptides-like [Gigantopelta aegis]